MTYHRVWNNIHEVMYKTANYRLAQASKMHRDVISLDTDVLTR